MLRLLALLLCLLPLEAATIILVRHAEKAGPTGDVPLSAQGQERATLLAKMLRDLPLKAIYVTEFQRTQQTAAPTASAHHLTPQIIPAKQMDDLIARLKAAGKDDVILVVSHSNVVPDLAARLATKIPDMDESDYSRLIIINTTASPASLLTLRYGQ
jgi:broad specificity phosphatase PhoE